MQLACKAYGYGMGIWCFPTGGYCSENVTVYWTLRDNVQAKLRVLVKRLLKKYKYPPDMQQKATDTVLDQAKLLCKDWAENNS
jgi:hypothetical protein